MPLITQIGNKRKLVPYIEAVIEEVKRRLGKNRVVALDAFAGSSAVSRMLVRHCSTLYCNDLERYSYIVCKTALSCPSPGDKALVKEWIEMLNNCDYDIIGDVCKHYAPLDTNEIKPGERAFYSRENALRIDTMRSRINSAPDCIRDFLLSALIEKASVNNNCSGVFKGFHKKDGVGAWGGRKGVCLSRILRDIVLEVPDFCGSPNCAVNVSQKDANELVRELGHVDIAYFDTPYNCHPYGSNYFLLNIICDGHVQENPSGVSGIPRNWNRSAYNSTGRAAEAMRDLIVNVDADFVVISYGSEGIIKDWGAVFTGFKYETHEIDYPTYKGCRNLHARSKEVKEILFVVDKRTPPENTAHAASTNASTGIAAIAEVTE